MQALLSELNCAKKPHLHHVKESQKKEVHFGFSARPVDEIVLGDLAEGLLLSDELCELSGQGEEILPAQEGAYERVSTAKDLGRLFLGPYGAANDRTFLQANDVRHMVSISSHLEHVKPRRFDDVHYLALSLPDHCNADTSALLHDAFVFVRYFLQRGRNVLVHCQFGVSRSATVVVHLLMELQAALNRRVSRDICIDRVRRFRPVVLPNRGFMAALFAEQSTLNRRWLRRNLLRALQPLLRNMPPLALEESAEFDEASVAAQDEASTDSKNGEARFAALVLNLDLKTLFLLPARLLQRVLKPLMAQLPHNASALIVLVRADESVSRVQLLRWQGVQTPVKHRIMASSTNLLALDTLKKVFPVAAKKGVTLLELAQCESSTLCAWDDAVVGHFEATRLNRPRHHRRSSTFLRKIDINDDWPCTPLLPEALRVVSASPSGALALCVADVDDAQCLTEPVEFEAPRGRMLRLAATAESLGELHHVLARRQRRTWFVLAKVSIARRTKFVFFVVVGPTRVDRAVVVRRHAVLNALQREASVTNNGDSGLSVALEFACSSLDDCTERKVTRRLREVVQHDEMLLRVMLLSHRHDGSTTVSDGSGSVSDGSASVSDGSGPVGEYGVTRMVWVPPTATVADLQRHVERLFGIRADAQRLSHVVLRLERQQRHYGKVSPVHVAITRAESPLIGGDYRLCFGDTVYLQDGRETEAALKKQKQRVPQTKALAQILTNAMQKKEWPSLRHVSPPVSPGVSSARTGDQVRADGDGDDEDSLVRHIADARLHTLQDEMQSEEEDIDFDDLIVVKPRIGQGRSAVVSHALWRTADVAVKEFNYARLTKHVVDEFRKEIRVLRRLHHPNIMQFVGVCREPEHLAIVTEYLPRGSLRNILQDETVEVTFGDVVRMACDVAEGMKYLHAAGMIHRDLKSHNLLVDEEWTVKVADMGATKILEAQGAFTECGTSGWVAPEVFDPPDSGYDSKIDVFSFAVCVWEMLTRCAHNPLAGRGIFRYVRDLQAGERPSLPEWLPALHPVARLVADCWEFDPRRRPTFVEIAARLQRIREGLAGDELRHLVIAVPTM